MANDLNRVMLIGRLARDPEFKQVGGTSLVNFTLANGRTYVTNGEKRDESHFFDCEAWGKAAEILNQYTRKGKQVAIEGRLKQDTWETAEGKKASRIRIVVENFQLLGSKDDGMGGGSSSSYEQSSSSYDPGPSSYSGTAPAMDSFETDDDIPF